jgi:hypothetical protein
MPRAPWSLWLAWAVCFASLAVWPALPRLAAPPAESWNAAETAVAGFVLAILALVAAIGSFALRESLVDHEEGCVPLETTPEGRARVRIGLVELWLLCAGVGALGGVLVRYSAYPATGWPYVAGAALLLLLHAPTRRFFGRVCGEPMADGAARSA